MKKDTFDLHICIPEIDEDAVVEVTVTGGEDPIVSGPPEMWDPGEAAEVTINRVWLEESKVWADVDALMETNPGLRARIEDLAVDEAAERDFDAVDGEEDWADDLYDDDDGDWIQAPEILEE